MTPDWCSDHISIVIALACYLGLVGATSILWFDVTDGLSVYGNDVFENVVVVCLIGPHVTSSALGHVTSVSIRCLVILSSYHTVVGIDRPGALVTGLIGLQSRT